MWDNRLFRLTKQRLNPDFKLKEFILAEMRNEAADLLKGRPMEEALKKPFLVELKELFLSRRIIQISDTATPNQQAHASHVLHQILLAVLLHAITDDDRVTVDALLSQYPELLLEKLADNLVIVSQYTHQKFYAEGALMIAVKRKQIEMIKILLPYYDNLEQTEEVLAAKNEALLAWKDYEIQRNLDDVDEIVIPKEYADLARSFIDVFRTETFPNGVPRNVALSDATEAALSSLLNLLAPKSAVELDNCIDPELFLLALYNAYVNNFNLFQNWNKLDAFCVRVIGLAQSVLSPETAKIFCRSLYRVVEKNKKFDGRASGLRLKGGEGFYRVGREYRFGLGVEFFCTIFGRSGSLFDGGALEWGRRPSSFEKSMLNKSNKFSELLHSTKSHCPNKHLPVMSQ